MTILDARDGAATSPAIAQAVDRIVSGGLVAMPTETVYGLAARADDDAAVAGVFAAKGRPSEHPLIVHVLDEAAAQAFAQQWPPVARRLVQAFWPGPLTVIVPRRPEMARAAAGGQPSVGLRCPSHPVARALLRACADRGVAGLAAPSANRFGRVSPTRAAHVAQEFGEDLLVLDGGDCDVGIESSIVDCTRGVPVLLRPGVLTREQIEAAAAQPLVDPDGSAPRASGTLASHYAPRARVRLMEPAMLRTALELLAPADELQSGNKGVGTLAVYSRAVVQPGGVMFRRMPVNAADAAHELFAVLREFDEAGARLIWVENPPQDPAWDGVRDRLQRAAAEADPATPSKPTE